ncbi:spore coat protein CotJB [Massilimicrobiota sp. An142]|uniref:spore coat protein CotJB n=1 Tax=Massilimicrobiota sp. An142 TaxID=1965564 RepID=UPI001F14B149|nr:spore coat protein CotJB [Massilimicrobiota sp. An142]MEE0778122.1 spore coat protein CotJB [Massilimicrobiota sp.]
MNIFQEDKNCFSPFYMSNQTRQSQPVLFDPQEAISLGNLFKDLYMSYQGFSNYCLQPENARQQALLEVQMYYFVAHEINLYLDMHPHDEKMIQLYEQYIQKAKQSQDVFEKRYGPLEVQNTQNKIPFEWIQGPWPWEYQKD